MRDLRVSFPKPCDAPWQAMVPAGCARLCARCDQEVHDLSQYGLDEAEALLRSNPGACVRARIGTDGIVELKPGRQGRPRRMMVAAALSAALVAAGQPALARQERPRGEITGQVEAYSEVRVRATDQSGRTFRTKVKRDGRYRLRGLPAGTYTLSFRPSCGDSWTVENVVVGEGVTEVPMGDEFRGCIIVGLLHIEDDNAG
jgi:hypothetical protein